MQELEVRISCCRESKCNAPKKYRWNQQILLQQQEMDDQRESIANLPSLLLPKGLPSSNTKEKALDIDNRWKVPTLVKIYFLVLPAKIQLICIRSHAITIESRVLMPVTNSKNTVRTSFEKVDWKPKQIKANSTDMAFKIFFWVLLCNYYKLIYLVDIN